MPGFRLVLALVAIVVLAPPAAAADGAPAEQGLKGQFLIASPRMPDPRFRESVIYMVEHDAQGAMGLIVNKAIGRGPLKALLERLGIQVADTEETVRLHFGGPVDPGRGFVLHSEDYQGANTAKLATGLALSVDAAVLQAIAEGKGPRKALIIFGYSGWAPRQLEGELARDDWLIAPAEADLIFTDDLESVWDKAFRKAGIKL